MPFPTAYKVSSTSYKGEIFSYLAWLNDGPQKGLISLMPGNLVCNIEHDIISCASAKKVFRGGFFFSNYNLIFITVDPIIPKGV